MSERLEELARKLDLCRERGNKLALECVIESARILQEAKALSRRGFGKWLRDQAHMDYNTANHHLAVAEFVKRNSELTPTFCKLSIAKMYALSRLDRESLELALQPGTFSKPVGELSDVEFHLEFPQRFPAERKKKRSRHNTKVSLKSAIAKLERAIKKAAPMDPMLTRQMMEKCQELNQLLAGWKVVA